MGGTLSKTEINGFSKRSLFCHLLTCSGNADVSAGLIGARLHRRGPIAPSGPDRPRLRIRVPIGARLSWAPSTVPSWHRLVLLDTGKPALSYNMLGLRRGTIAPRSGPDCTVGPRSGPDCTVGPRSGPDCTVGPRSGSDCTVGPRSGPDFTVGPRSGSDCTVGPRSGSDCTVGPRSGRRAPTRARLRALLF